jgi:hypothetical protein
MHIYALRYIVSAAARPRARDMRQALILVPYITHGANGLLVLFSLSRPLCGMNTSGKWLLLEFI